MGIAAGISAIGSLGAGLLTSNASSQAAQLQAQAAQQSLAFQQGVYNQTQQNLGPYRQTGRAAANALSAALPQLTSQFSPTESSLAATPGYQFDLSQGLKATQNAAAARGLGVSGAALKGASSYATGLADNTLQTQFNIDQQNKQNAFSKLYSTAGLGESAAAAGGGVGAVTGSTANNALLTGAQGASTAATTAGTAFNPLLNSLGSYYTTQQWGPAFANKLVNGGLYGSSS